MDHPTTQNFDKATVFADLAALAMAKVALDIHPHAGSDFGVVFVTKTQFDIFPKEKLVKLGKNGFEVLNVDSLVDDKALILIEKVGVGRTIGFVAITFAGNNNPQGGLLA